MKIGIIGAGHIGGTLGMLWAQSGHDVMLSSRHPEGLDTVLKQAGPHSCKGTAEEAAQYGETVVLAIPLGEIAQVVPRIEKFLDGKVVLDAMNPYVERDGEAATEIFQRKIASGQATQERFPRAKVVRAFSSVYYLDLQQRSNRASPSLAIPLASDDIGARAVAAQLIHDAGFDPFDVGSLEKSKVQDPGGVLYGKALTCEQAAELLQRQTV